MHHAHLVTQAVSSGSVLDNAYFKGRQGNVEKMWDT